MKKFKYGENFFSKHNQIAYKSAINLVPILLDFIQIHSVIDVGCGMGYWLRAFQDFGIHNITGYDISNLSKDQYGVSIDNLVLGFDLVSKEFPPNTNCDILLCLEVAEHLPQKSSFEFIKKITRLSPLILFSAAIPGQTGDGHINEQYPSYWGNLFQQNQFTEIDFIKPLIWNNLDIAWWYRQNVTMFVRNESLINYPKLNQISQIYNQRLNNPKLILVSENIFQKNNETFYRKISRYFGKIKL